MRKFCSSEVTKFSHSFLLPLRCCPLSAEHRIFCRRAFSESFFLSISPDRAWRPIERFSRAVPPSRLSQSVFSSPFFRPVFSGPSPRKTLPLRLPPYLPISPSPHLTIRLSPRFHLLCPLPPSLSFFFPPEKQKECPGRQKKGADIVTSLEQKPHLSSAVPPFPLYLFSPSTYPSR